MMETEYFYRTNKETNRTFGSGGKEAGKIPAWYNVVSMKVP